MQVPFFAARCRHRGEIISRRCIGLFEGFGFTTYYLVVFDKYWQDKLHHQLDIF